MGQTQSGSSEVPVVPEHSKVNVDMINKFWEGAVGNNESNKDHLNSKDFIDFLGSRPFAKEIFKYVSLDNETVEMHFFISRISDIMQNLNRDDASHHTLWASVIVAVELSPSIVLGIAMGSHDPIPCEATSVDELQKLVPSIARDFDTAILGRLFNNEYPVGKSSSFGLADSKLVTLTHRRLISAVLCRPTNTSDMIYQSSRDGLSFRVMAASIRHYPGSLLSLFADSDSRIYAIHCNRSQWDETNGSFDETALDTVLLQLSPELRVRRVKPRGGTNCIYFNAGNTRHFIGIGFGGREPTFRLSLGGTDFPTVKSLDLDATFEAGQLLSSVVGHEASNSEISSRVLGLEVHGLGGDDAKQRQVQKKMTDSDVRMDRKRVDRSRMVENQFDREVLFPKTFATQHDRLGS